VYFRVVSLGLLIRRDFFGKDVTEFSPALFMTAM
jgi:hypothetical protein